MAKFLYVEDDDLIRMMVEGMMAIEMPANEVVTATNFKEAKEALLSKGPFDAIVSDYNYPGPDNAKKTNVGGLDLLELRQKNHNHVPFAFTSSKTPEVILTDVKERQMTPPDLIVGKEGAATMQQLFGFLRSSAAPKPVQAVTEPAVPKPQP